MTKHRPHRYTKSDANQAPIVKLLRYRGFDVEIVAGLAGIYDIVVSGRRHFHNKEYRCISAPVSVRVELKVEGQYLSPKELEFYENLKHPDAYIVATSPVGDPMPAVREIEAWFGNGKS